MNARPILFSTPMVLALIAGAKTQTRRIVKITRRTPGLAACLQPRDPAWVRLNVAAELCPYGKPGDLLWVRETWAQPTSLDPGPTFYRADYPHCVPSHFENVPEVIRWKPSIHMPRAASRLTLRITEVRVERLQEITEEDARAEGMWEVQLPSGPIWIYSRLGTPGLHVSDTACGAYYQLWKVLNGRASWDANPWVWALSFAVEHRNVDAGA